MGFFKEALDGRPKPTPQPIHCEGCGREVDPSNPEVVQFDDGRYTCDESCLTALQQEAAQAGAEQGLTHKDWSPKL